MKLLAVLVTHNRLELTKRTVESFRNTIKTPCILVCVDNASTDGTQEWLLKNKDRYDIQRLILNSNNEYPGKACNQGWKEGLQDYKDITHLMRIDNDLEFKPGWDTEAQELFAAFPDLGQLGLMNQEQEFYPEANKIVSRTAMDGKEINTYWMSIGGPCIIPIEVWAKGVRYSEKPWYHDRGPTAQEDMWLSVTIRGLGYFHGNMIPNLVWHLGDRAFMDQYPKYYKKTFNDRGYNYEAWREGRIEPV